MPCAATVEMPERRCKSMSKVMLMVCVKGEETRRALWGGTSRGKVDRGVGSEFLVEGKRV